jgi:phosphoribosylaminoimidazole-succinocarboxamide synthase
MTDPIERITAQLPHTLAETDWPQLGRLVRGKVRDVYVRDRDLVLVTTDRVSAFDRVLGTIPFKGQILNRMAQWGFDTTADLVQNHLISSPDPNVMVVRKCTPFPVEFVVRGYIAGSLWRDHLSGQSAAYEVDLPADLRPHQALPEPVLTPSTKAEHGQHDRPTSRREILERGWMTRPQWEAAEACALSLFRRGQELAAERGLILADTKYELGLDPEGNLTLIDELHTADSSRYWWAHSYRARFEAGEVPEMLDKENLRAWLRDTRGYTGDGPAPPLDDRIRTLVATRYWTVCAQLTAEPFEPAAGPVLPRIEEALRAAGWLA